MTTLFYFRVKCSDTTHYVKAGNERNAREIAAYRQNKRTGEGVRWQDLRAARV